MACVIIICHINNSSTLSLASAGNGLTQRINVVGNMLDITLLNQFMISPYEVLFTAFLIWYLNKSRSRLKFAKSPHEGSVIDS